MTSPSPSVTTGRHALWSCAGSALAASAYVAIAAVRLRSFPSTDLALLALAGAAIGGLPAVVVLGLRTVFRRKKSDAPPPDLVALIDGAFAVAALLALLQSLVFVLLRVIAASLGLVVANPPWFRVAVPIGMAVLLLVAARLVPHVSRRLVARGVTARAVAGGALALLALTVIAFGRPVDRGAAAAPRDAPAQDAPTLLVVAIDGVGVDMLERVAARMPNLSALARESSRGELVPPAPYLSPYIWTAVATGLPPAEHGVTTFEMEVKGRRGMTIPIDRFYMDPVPGLLLPPLLAAWKAGRMEVIPSGRRHWRGDPFWVRPDAGRVGLACWLATWPADPVPGAVVTDRWAPDLSRPWFGYPEIPARATHPESLRETLAPMRRTPDEPASPALLALAPFTPDEIAKLSQLPDPRRPFKEFPLGNLHTTLATDASCFAATQWMAENVKPRTLAVYFQRADMAAHLFHVRADGTIPGFSAEDSRRLAPLHEAVLAHVDAELGQLLAHAGPDTTVVVLSDHGMAASDDNLLFGAWHEGNGFALVRGPGFGPERSLGVHPPEWFHSIFVEALAR